MRPNSKAAPAVTPWTVRPRVLLVLTGLLMPGGVLLLAWMLCRRFFPRLSGQVMKRWVQTLLLIDFLQGCATQIGFAARDLAGRGNNTRSL